MSSVDPANLSDSEAAELARASVNAHVQSGALGITSTSTDGVTTNFDPRAALDVATTLQGRAARAGKRRSIFQPISLRGPGS